MRIPPVLLDLEARHPGVLRLLREIAEYFRCPYTDFAAGIAARIETPGIDRISSGCRDLECAGILPDIRVETVEQVAAIWRWPIFQIILDDIVGFMPPADVDTRTHLPAQCRTEADARARVPFILSAAPYWQRSLYLNFPEFYLDPFLPATPGRTLLGCDIACGWGRISLGLRNYANRHIFCCDFGFQGLQRLWALAGCAGLRQHLSPQLCDMAKLPFGDGCIDFFLAFDVFEHLPDAALRRCLSEILRCARPGAVLYTEIPLHDYCPAVTHIQDFSYSEVTTLFGGCQFADRRFELRHHHPELPGQFTFAITV